MFDSLLIANRGEIACRIIGTARRMGLRTVAVFSDADADALHVRLADERYRIGPAAATASYLRPEAIVAAARAHGVAAIHPGYGFLSERVELAELCAPHGIVWVGPSPRCIAAMGSKIGAMRIAADAGVPSVPGYHGDEQSDARLRREADAIGYPLLIKASAGGGGKGMRRVDAAGDFAAALHAARHEARAAFGDDRVMLERLLLRPRHLEVQVAGDRHGNVVHLFERECSIQRNYQKLVEEAPAPNLDDAVREHLRTRAVRLARAVGYDSLGTVEFILEPSSSEPYFLEMNTRLQVEHTVTEAITGLDLVEWQLRIAAGETLKLAQAEIAARGAAIEVRINAEDPSRDHRPQLGQVGVYREPSGQGVRVDSGIARGSVVTPHYDSLLLKLIGSGADRAAALRTLAAALDRLVVLGVGSNQAFQRDMLRSAAFARGALTTAFIAETFPEGWRAPAADPKLPAVAAVAMLAARRPGAEAVGVWGRLAGFRVLGRAGLPGRWRARVRDAQGADATLDVLAVGDGYAVEAEGRRLDLHVTVEADALHVVAGDAVALLPFHVAAAEVFLFASGSAHRFEVRPLLETLADGAAREAAEGTAIVAPMPGLLTEVHATAGQSVRKGEVLVVEEAMKLVLRLAAPVDGTVQSVPCRVGQTVAGGAVLVAIVPAS